MKQAICIPILLMGALFASASAQAEMYKWTDKSGKTHYTATPPPADAKGKDIEDDIRLSTGKLGNTPAQTGTTQAPTDEMEKAREDGKKSEEKHHDFCQQQSDAYKQMTANSLVKWKDAQGERFLTAEEKTKKMKEIEKNIESMCKPEMFGSTPDRQTSGTEAIAGKDASNGTESLSLSGGKAGSTGEAGATGNGSATSGSDAGNAPVGSMLPSTD